jgi:hypothetical protein
MTLSFSDCLYACGDAGTYVRKKSQSPRPLAIVEANGRPMKEGLVRECLLLDLESEQPGSWPAMAGPLEKITPLK